MIEKYKKYYTFEGTANRSEYWGVTLISYALLLFVVLIGVAFTFLGSLSSILGLLIILFGLVMSGWVSLATTVRRCRDAGINVWFTLTIFIPWFGVIPWIVFGCLKTDTTDK